MKLIQGIVAVVILARISAFAFAEQPYELVALLQTGTAGDDFGWSAAIDVDGNAYLAGRVVPFDVDGFVSKNDSSGDLLWSHRIGGSQWDEAFSIALDVAGNAFVGGHTSSDLFGAHAGGSDGFIIKYDASGNEIWSRQFGTDWNDRIVSVAVDPAGSAYAAGYTSRPFSFDPPVPQTSDAYLVKYDASGDLLWSRQFGSDRSDRLQSVAVDASGNAYITGYTSGDLDGTNAGGDDAFFTKYDASGNLMWTRQFGTSVGDAGLSVAIDGVGNAYITGITQGNLGGANQGGWDVFLTKYDLLGNLLWSRQIGTAVDERGVTPGGVKAVNSVALDEAGNAYICGATLGSLGGRNAGALDVFLSKFDPSGNLLWSQQIGTPSNDQPGSVVVDESGAVYISGFTQGDFGAGNGGGYDVFLAKFVPQPLAGDFNDDGNVDAADYIVWRKGFSTGVYTEDDYSTWRENFGAPAAGAGAVAHSASPAIVPEPAGTALGLLGLVCFGMQCTASRGRRRSAHIRSTT
jgi:hypothetical protein